MANELLEFLIGHQQEKSQAEYADGIVPEKRTILSYGQILTAMEELREGFIIVDRRALRWEGHAYGHWAQLSPLVAIAARLYPHIPLAWADDKKAAELLGIGPDLRRAIEAAQDAEGEYDSQLRTELFQAVGL